MTKLHFTLNGREVVADSPPETLLVDLLRGPLGLTGTHAGCDTAQCGACTVHVDGAAVKSCNLLAAQASGRTITTIEGLAPEGTRHPLQQAFIDCHGLQCGFCTPGMIMTAACLLHTTPQPSDDQIAAALEGNLCRCTGYANIVAAVRQAAGQGGGTR